MNDNNGHIPLASAEIDNLFVPLDGTEWHEQGIAISLLFADWFGAKLNLFFSLADLPPLVNRGLWRQRAQLSAANVSHRNLVEHADDDPLLQNGALYEYGKMVAHSYLDGIRNRLEHLDVTTAKEVAAGSPAHILTFRAQTSDNSIIIMQARPQVGIQRFIARKMPENLLTTATVPVLMHSGDKHDSTDYGEYAPRVVILPMRDEPAMAAALPYVLSLAQKANADIKIVFGIDNGAATTDQQESQLESIAAQVEQLHIHLDVERTDMPLDEAVAHVEGRSVGAWVIMGSRMKRGVLRRAMSSQIDNVRRLVECPLIAVPVREILPKRESAIDRWLIDWNADRAAMESDQRWWNRRSMQRSVTGALTRIRRSDIRKDSSEDNGST